MVSNMTEYTVDKYGTQRWWKNGKVHRTDGPAVTRPDGTQRWCVFGNNKNAYWIYTYHTAWAFT